MLTAAVSGLTCQLRAAMLERFIGLIAAIGLRNGEAMALNRTDAT